MIFIFERGASIIELETRYDNDTSEYVLELRQPDTSDQLERFENAGAFRERLAEIERGLEGRKWRRSGPPVLVPEGFPTQRPPR
jgi:hypothetical protein